MRVALVGVGRFGRRYLQTLRVLPQLQLVAVASRNPASDALLPPGCVRLDDWKALLELPGLQGVLVVSPPASHAQIVRAAVQRGLAVLVEKPLALDTAEAESLLALPATAPVMVEHTHLFAPAYEALRRRVSGVGIRRIEVDAGGHGPWRADVGVLWDWGPHWIAVCLDLLGRAPARCSRHVLAARRVHGGIGESLRLELDFGDDTLASLRLDNLLAAPRRRLRVVTAQERVLVYDELREAPLTEQCDDDAPVVVPVTATRPLQLALREFAAAMQASLAGRVWSIRSDLRFGVEVVRVLAACERAGNGP